MSIDMYGRQLETKRKKRIEAEEKAASFQTKESSKRSEAAKSRLAASRTRSEHTAKSKTREAERKEKEAEAAGKEATKWRNSASKYRKEELSLEAKLAKAERSAADAKERQRKRDKQNADRQAAAEKAALESRMRGTEATIDQVLRQLPAPKREKLRVLLLGAASQGDLRVGREQKRIRAAVESALHRDWIELDVRPSATTDDFLDGMTKFRPHVVHFSGHSTDSLIVFEDDRDEGYKDAIVTAHAFANAIRATDEPPLLVLLNPCNSASQIDDIVSRVAPFAIGMADSIGDVDAINYAARFYASIADGQSIESAHNVAKSSLELLGLESSELPTLTWAPNFDPSETKLVQPGLED